MSRVKYAMNYRPKNSFSMSYASRKVIFPGVGISYHISLLLITHEIERSLQLKWLGLGALVILCAGIIY